MLEEPLIFTTKGNLPISALRYSHQWEDLETCIKFTETYTLDDEIVKQAVHVMMKAGQESSTQQARL
jgi:hypothetical protein